MDFWYRSSSDSAYSETAQLSPIQKTDKGECGVFYSLGSDLLTVGQDWHLRQKSEVHRKEVHIPRAVQEKSRQHGSKRYETVSFWVGSYTICRWKGFTEVSSIPISQKQRSQISKASKRCLEAKAKKCKEGTSTSRKDRGVHEVVPEVQIRWNLHLDFGNSTRMHHRSTQAAQNRLPKHLRCLSTSHLLWSLQEQRFRSDSLQASTTSGKEGCSRSFKSQYWKRAYRWPAYDFGTGKGCLPHSKHRYGVGKFGKQKMGTHCLCLLNKIPAFFICSISLEATHGAASNRIQ